MQSFEKSSACPTNEALLAFLQAQPDELPANTETHIVEHLAVCEFCELTLELLRAHPAAPLPPPPLAPPVPKRLRQLFPVHK